MKTGRCATGRSCRSERKGLLCGLRSKSVFGLLAALVMVLGLSVQAHAILIVRGTDSLGYQLIYDTDRDITWYDYTTVRTWPDAMDWASNLVVDFGGNPITGWRLPTALNEDGSGPCQGYDCTGSEMGHLYYIDLGNPAGGPLDTSFIDGLTGNTERFIELYILGYWSSTPGPPLGSWTRVWGFRPQNGSQNPYISLYYYDGYPNYYTGYAMAVRDGDVSAPVPEPGTLILLGSGLAGVGALARKRRRS